MIDPNKDYTVRGADLQRVLSHLDQLPQQDAMDIAHVTGIQYTLAELRLPQENAPTAGKQSQGMRNNKSRSL